MNILYLTHSYLPAVGGVQRSVHNLAEEFMRRGHRIVIACDADKPFRFQRLPPAPVLSLRIPYPFHQPVGKRIEAHLLDCANLAALAALCIRNRIKLVHCHLINVDTRYAMTLKRWLGVKVVITLRGGEFHHWIANRPARRNYVRQMLESADAVTALSHSQMDDARKLGTVLPPDCAVIPNPADPPAIARQASSGTTATNGPPYILFSGRLEEQKRVDMLLAAYHAIIAQEPQYPCDLLIAGDGSSSPALQQQARNGPGAPRIRFLGNCRYEDSLALIRDAAALVLLSQEAEGCPNVILEAMALGTPIIVSDYGPLRELVTHGVNGEVFPPADSAALQNTLRCIPLDAQKRARYAAAARRHLEERHRFDRIADAYEQLYRRLATPSRTNATAPK